MSQRVAGGVVSARCSGGSCSTIPVICGFAGTLFGGNGLAPNTINSTTIANLIIGITNLQH